MTEIIKEEYDLTEEQLLKIEQLISGYLIANGKIDSYGCTLAHEMGHLRVGIKKGFKFGFIRVSNSCVFRDENNNIKNLKLNVIDTITTGYASKGVCYVFAPREMSNELMKKAYICVLNAGPIATVKYCNDNKNVIKDEILSKAKSSNPIMDSQDEKVKDLYDKKVKSKQDSDQKLIERILKDNSFEEVTKINNILKSVGDALNGINSKLIPGQALPVIKAIKRYKE